jgi:hypothetical protein
MIMRVRIRSVALVGVLLVTAAGVWAGVSAAQAGKPSVAGAERPVSIEVFAPGDGDNAGIHGIGWFVDIEVDFPPNGL